MGMAYTNGNNEIHTSWTATTSLLDNKLEMEVEGIRNGIVLTIDDVKIYYKTKKLALKAIEKELERIN